MNFSSEKIYTYTSLPFMGSKSEWTSLSNAKVTIRKENAKSGPLIA